VMAVALYGSRHPYGYTEIGTEAATKSITREEMLEFWRRNFVPNSAALVVAGDISMADLRARAEKAFGAWARGTPVRPVLGTPDTTRAKVIVVDMPGTPQTQLRVAGIGAARSTPDFRALQVARRVSNAVIVVVFCDGGEKYLSERFWDEEGGGQTETPPGHR